jgi:hypothetical protein
MPPQPTVPFGASAPPCKVYVPSLYLSASVLTWYLEFESSERIVSGQDAPSSIPGTRPDPALVGRQMLLPADLARGAPEVRLSFLDLTYRE